VLEQNVFVERVLPGAILRKLTDAEMAVYRAPFPDAKSRPPVVAWPRPLPLGGEAAEIIAVLGEDERWLATSDVPKLLLTFEPGVLITEPVVRWCQARFRNLTVRKIGPGAHFVPEDHPVEIGDAVKEWRWSSVLGQA